MPEDTKETAVTAPGAAEAPAKTDRADDTDGRLDRIVQETRRLGDDITEWVNLKLRLVQLDIQERIDQELDLVFSGVIVLAMIMIALLMASFGLAFILGDLLGRLWYGFAIIALIYILAAIVISRLRPRLAAGFRSSWVNERADRDLPATNDDQ